MSDVPRADEICFFNVIHVKDSNRKTIDFIKWENLRYDTYNRFKWYFTYRAALLQVKYPKAYVEVRTGHHIPDTTRQLHILQNRLRAKKAKVTEIANKIAEIKAKHNSLFTVEEDNRWPLVIAKQKKAEQDLIEAQKEFDNFIKQHE